MDIRQNLASNIALHRKALKLTQAELAEKLNYSDKAVSKWERGEAVPELTVLKQIADFFNVTIDSLLQEPKEPKIPSIKTLGKRRTSIALWATSIVWIVATLCFVFLGMIFEEIENSWLSFIVAIPITLIVLLVLTSVWGKNLLNFIFASLLVWTILLAVFLVLLHALASPPAKLWFVFLLGIPIQAFLAFLFLYKSTRKKQQ